MSLGSFLFGRKSKTERLPLYSPEQMASQNRLLQMAMSGMQNPYEGFEPIQQQAISRFRESIPSLAERFTTLSPTSQRSSGFQSALGRAQAGLEESLAAMRSQYGLQNKGQMMNMAQFGLRPQFENMYHPATHGLFGELSGPLLKSGLGLGLGAMTGSGLLGRTLMNQYGSGQGLGSFLPFSMLMGGGM